MRTRVSILGWLRTVRFEVFSRPDHWAKVMVEADALEADHDGDAPIVADAEARVAPEFQGREFFRDVSSVLKMRKATSRPPHA
jgi:hypothetical protein